MARCLARASPGDRSRGSAILPREGDVAFYRVHCEYLLEVMTVAAWLGSKTCSFFDLSRRCSQIGRRYGVADRGEMWCCKNEDTEQPFCDPFIWSFELYNQDEYCLII
ncbi:hypothetical protein chiPu_0006123 [Chiloscyllium punctatum]|uniref:Uncharacterized protein n=1 Tax=Chiloscyllium punctatum TaxID=137246 RepID=A0A401SBC2_CHIPU|nr:hypothetical protein [Chiloscyllium punctatum]